MHEEDGAAPTVRVLVVDDHRMFGESLARLLSDDGAITVVGVAASGREGIEMAQQHQPQVVLVDYNLPDIDGVRVTAAIKEGDAETIVIMMTGSTDDRVMLDAIEAGGSGFLTKDRTVDEVVAAIRAAAAGEALISAQDLVRLLPMLRPTPPEPVPDLTDRELEILGCIARGMANKAIALELNLSVNTIRNYVQSLLSKLGAHSKLEAVSTAVRRSIIEYPPKD